MEWVLARELRREPMVFLRQNALVLRPALEHFHVSGIMEFITTGRRTILNKANELGRELGDAS